MFCLYRQVTTIRAAGVVGIEENRNRTSLRTGGPNTICFVRANINGRNEQHRRK